MTTRKGKIARLPRQIRDAVNLMLEANIPGKMIVNWLNAKTEVQEMLKMWFKGDPVTKQNLSEWKQGGYLDWERHEDECDIVRRLTERADGLCVAADGAEISSHVSAFLSVELARVAQVLLDEKTNTKERWRLLQELLRSSAELRQGDYNAGKLELKRQQWILQATEKQAGKKSIEKALPVYRAPPVTRKPL